MTMGPSKFSDPELRAAITDAQSAYNKAYRDFEDKGTVQAGRVARAAMSELERLRSEREIRINARNLSASERAALEAIANPPPIDPGALDTLKAAGFVATVAGHAQAAIVVTPAGRRALAITDGGAP